MRSVGAPLRAPQFAAARRFFVEQLEAVIGDNLLHDSGTCDELYLLRAAEQHEIGLDAQAPGPDAWIWTRSKHVLDDVEKKLLVHSWRLVVPIKDTAADLFYRRLFELEPGYRRLFHADMAVQKQKLIAMLSFVVQSLDWPESAWRDEVAEEDDLFLVVLALGRRHADLYRVPDVAYEAVGQALLWTLDYGLGKEFTPAVRAAWTKVYGLLATAMKMGRLSVVSPASNEPRVAGGAAAGRSEAEPS